MTKETRAEMTSSNVLARQSGYVLLPVAIAIALIGVLAFLIANESAVEVNATSSEFEAVRADYVAQAGLQHGLQLAAQQGCGPYTDLANVALGSDKYGTGLTTDLGSTSTFRVDVDQDTWIDSNNPDQDNSGDAKLQVGLQNGKIERSLLRYDLSAVPAGAKVLSATAHFYLNIEHDKGPVNIHQLASDWQDSTATWNTMGDKMAATILATIPAQPRKDIWIEVNLTSLVQAWVNGQANYGIALDTTSEGNKGEYFGVDTGPRKPYITVITGTPPSSPAKLKSVGSLSNGTSRTLLRDVTLRQGPASHVVWQHDATLGVDAYIWEWNPNTNYGSDDEIWVAYGGSNSSRSLLRFAIESLPRGAKIIDATLSLEHESGNDPDVPVTAHRVTKYWEEGEATWNRRETGINWDTAGGDFAAAIFATTEVGPASGVRYEWDLTGLVQGWIDGTFPNYGVALATELDGAFGERFFSSDETDATRRPRLSVTYSCQCGITCSVAQGSGGRIVLLGDWGGSEPNPIDVAKATLMESWGYQVDHVDDDVIWTIDFNDYDLVYVSETVRAGDVSGQIEWRSIGIVNEEGDLLDNIGFAAGEAYKVGSTVEVVDNSHYITAPFATGNLSIYNGGMEILYGGGALGSGMQPLADVGGDASLMVLDTGAIGVNGAAAGKRVALPVGRFGDSGFDWAHLNANGRLLVQRSLEWASGGSVVTIGNLLLVVGNDSSLTAQELARQSLFEGWGWAVTVIDEDDNQAAFDAALAGQDVVYVPEDVVAADLNTKLVSATVGVVTEEANLVDEFGFAAGINWDSGTDLKVDRSHYITSTLPPTAYTILTSPESFAGLSGARAPGLRMIGESAAGTSLASLETGASLYGGGSAAGRRVFLPWGGNDMDINHLNADGLTILQRSIEWASGAELDLSPLAHWKLDETSGTIAVDSEGGHDGTLANGPAWSPGVLDGGLEYDGVDDAIVVPHDDTLSLTEAMTFTAWVRSDAFGVSGPYDLVVSKGSVATSYAYYFGALGDEIIFGFSAAGSYREFVTPDLNLATGTWHHIAATFDNATNRVQLFHNGIRVFAAATTYEPSATTHDIYIGSSEDGADWDGVLDDVRIYDRALADAEIAELAKLPGPVVHWRLDETSGTTAVDAEGNHDGTLTNGPTWTPALINGGLEFDGSNDFVDGGSFDVVGVGLTMIGWFRADAIGTNDPRFVSKASGTAVQDAYWQLSTSNTGSNRFLRMRLKAGGTTSELIDSSVSLNPGQWYQAAATYDAYSGEMRLYLDGSQIASGSHAVGGPVDANPTVPVALGANGPPERFFDGLLDDFRIYDRPLGAIEISELYDASAPPGPGYTELYETWDATADDTWQTVDLGGFGVPANAVVEVAVYNDAGGNERWGGVRAVGSTLERRFLLHEAEQGGTDVVTMHVQTNANSEIQHYSDNDSDVRFVLLGYWTGASYTERFDSFISDEDGVWRTRGAGNHGLGPNLVAEIVMVNTDTGAQRLAGVRERGSSWQRRFNLQEAEGGGIDAMTLMVNTNADSEIQVYAQNDNDIDFYVVGFWSLPPGIYVENGAGLWNPSSNNWETVNLGTAGVPANAVVQVMMTNLNTSNEHWMGLRAVGSSEDRRLDLHEPEGGGADLASIHVNTDGSASIQSYSESSGTSTRFAPVGWWVMP